MKYDIRKKVCFISG